MPVRTRLSVICQGAVIALILALPRTPLLGQESESAAAPTKTGSIRWGDESPFRPLPLPAPNDIRTGAGRPGPDYWQQRVDYTIHASLDVATHTIRGSETIRYQNRSPDRLYYLWMLLDPNLCGPDGTDDLLYQPPLIVGEVVFDFSCTGGSEMRIEKVESGGRALAHTVHGTLMRVDLATPLEPRGELELVIDWSWEVPEYGYSRTARDGTLYQIAQWYPRMTVYDDLVGWNTEQFLGAGEFYLEYGDITVDLTVPAGYVVAATGAIRNPEDVLSTEQRRRLERAGSSSTPIAVITAEEALANAEQRHSGTRTWRFSAENVRDFAFAAAPNFQWDASNWKGILIHTFYRPNATWWDESNRMAHHSIRYFSEWLVHYPWPHATVVEGPLGGMEYPMITFVPTVPDRETFFFVLTHELGHEWFPMIVGSNERMHMWFDEGLNTFINLGSIQEYFQGEPYADTVVQHLFNVHPEHAVPGLERPVSVRPDAHHDLFWSAYQKPAMMLHLLRTEVLGEERFDRAFREYTEAWSYKHPSPPDFYRFMEDALGMDLDWFWRGWIYSTALLDQAVESIGASEEGSAIHLRSRGGLVMPVELRLTYEDGTSETVRIPVQMWYQAPDFVFRTKAGVTSAELDPRGVYPDVDRENNRWPRVGRN